MRPKAVTGASRDTMPGTLRRRAAAESAESLQQSPIACQQHVLGRGWTDSADSAPARRGAISSLRGCRVSCCTRIDRPVGSVPYGTHGWGWLAETRQRLGSRGTGWGTPARSPSRLAPRLGGRAPHRSPCRAPRSCATGLLEGARAGLLGSLWATPPRGHFMRGSTSDNVGSVALGITLTAWTTTPTIPGLSWPRPPRGRRRRARARGAGGRGPPGRRLVGDPSKQRHPRNRSRAPWCRRWWSRRRRWCPCRRRRSCATR